MKTQGRNERQEKREESDMDGWGEGEEVREKEKERKDKLRILKHKSVCILKDLCSLKDGVDILSFLT